MGKSGERLPTLVDPSIMMDDSGEVTAHFASIQVSVLKMSEKSLRYGEALFKSIFSNSPIPMMITARIDDTILEVDDGFLRRLGDHIGSMIRHTTVGWACG